MSTSSSSREETLRFYATLDGSTMEDILKFWEDYNVEKQLS